MHNQAPLCHPSALLWQMGLPSKEQDAEAFGPKQSQRFFGAASLRLRLPELSIAANANSTLHKALFLVLLTRGAPSAFTATGGSMLSLLASQWGTRII